MRSSSSFYPQDDLVTRADAEALAKPSRNNDAPILIDSGTGF